MLSLAPIKIGDWIVLLLGALGITWITITLWQGGAADKAIIRSSGKIFSEVPLSRNQIISVPGPLGISQIAIHNRQARIAADPSPRQLCVRQGWIPPGSAVVCLPNRVAVENAAAGYDTLNY